MKKTDLNSVFSVSLRLFTIIKEEYYNYLSNDKKEFLDKLDVFHLFRVIKDKKLPVFSFVGETVYLNNYYKEEFLNYLPFICLAILCGKIDPLKIGLIEKELKELNDKYALGYKTIHEKELDVASVVYKALLEDIPYPIIFIDNDADLFSYLAEEKGSKLALFYKELSDSMKVSEDYSETMDLIYDYLSNKVK